MSNQFFADLEDTMRPKRQAEAEVIAAAREVSMWPSLTKPAARLNKLSKALENLDKVFKQCICETCESDNQKPVDGSRYCKECQDCDDKIIEEVINTAVVQCPTRRKRKG